LILRKAKVERVTIVEFRVNKRSGNCFSSGIIIEERVDSTKTTDPHQKQDLERAEIWSVMKVMLVFVNSLAITVL
jgi:hypothetical protein